MPEWHEFCIIVKRDYLKQNHRGIGGGFAAASWIPMVEIATGSIEAENRGKTLGVISSGTSYGLILNGVLIPYLLTYYNWQAVWLVFGTLSLIIALFGLSVVYSVERGIFPRDPIPNEQNGSTSLVSTRSSLRTTYSGYSLLAACPVVGALIRYLF